MPSAEPAVTGLRFHRRTLWVEALDDAQQPQDENQDQQTAETDIHDTFLLLFFALKPEQARPAVPVVTQAAWIVDWGIILPVSKTPDLLDFLGLRRK